ncbi:MAG TPA: TonB-dependent receptor plug domain-containing protein [Opitutaceae bacterium]|nr:TonB-dependent receptor plug domain-containing protein [Opitutaceae bacterium]
MKTHRIPRSTLALLSVLTLVAGRTWAQTAPTNAAADAKQKTEDGAIVLSPFTVSTDKDKGYKATNATSGTRLNTAIKDIPINIDVITNEFMRDTGATDLRGALRYSAGIVLESQADAFAEDDGNKQGGGANDPRGVTRQQGDSTTKMRGFVIEQVLRDGFRRQYSADWINIDRVEVVRGPSALLYGVGSFGGIVNYVPKKPEHKAGYTIGASAGTDNFYRGEFDFTGPMGNRETPMKPAYRVTGAYQERGDYTQFYKEKHFMISPSFTFQPFPNTTIFLDNEFGHTKENGVGFQNVRTNIGTQVSDGDHSSRGATWLTDKYNIVTGVKTGENVDNRTFRWSGPDTYRQGPYRNNIIDVTQKLTENWYVKVGFAESEAVFDTRQIDGNTHPIRGTGIFTGTSASRAAKLLGLVVDSPISKQSAAANALIVSPPGFYTDGVIAYGWKDYTKTELRDQVRAETTYALDLGKWGKHNFLAGLQYMKLKSNEAEFGAPYSWVDGTHFVPDASRYNYKNPTDYTPFRFGTQGDGVADIPMTHLFNYKKRTWDLGFYGVYQGSFFKDRVNLIGGMRRDRSDARQSKTYIYESNRPVERQGLGAAGVASEIPVSDSPQVGLSFAVTKSLSVFGLYSTGTVPNYYAYDGNGNMMPPTKAKNYEAGIKFDLMQGRVSGTISAYRLERTGQPKFIWWAPSPYESAKKGYDPSKSLSTVAWYTMPSSMWSAIHNTPGMSTAQGTALAKQIWPTGWHALIDEISVAPNADAAWAGPLGSTFWNYAWMAEGPTANPVAGDTGTFYFPLVNLGDPNTAKFMSTIAQLPGWNGNYYYDAGKPYRNGSGAVGFGNAANGSGASVPMKDQARGWDASLIITPTDNLQLMVSFAHVDRKITSQTYEFVKAPYFPFAPWFQSDNNYGTLDSLKTAPLVYGNVNDTTTYNQTVPDYNEPGDDTPRNAASIWARYSLAGWGDRFKGWTVGAGGKWDEGRLWFSGFSGGGSNFTLEEGTRKLVKLYTDDRYVFNAMVEYKFKVRERYNWRVALNVDNVADDQDLYGLVYANGMSAKLSATVRF